MSHLYDEARAQPGGYRDIDPKRVAAARGEARIIDVREPAEYTGELGHAPGAELVPLGLVESAAQSWSKDAALVLVCRSGARSGRAATLLSSMGFEHVMNLAGGMLRWNEEHLPIER